MIKTNLINLLSFKELKIFKKKNYLFLHKFLNCAEKTFDVVFFLFEKLFTSGFSTKNICLIHKVGFSNCTN